MALRRPFPQFRHPSADFTRVAEPDDHFPELAAEWSPANPLSAWQVRPTGQTQFVPIWICSRTPEHTWQASLPSRSKGSGCPECREHGKSRVELEYHKAAEGLRARRIRPIGSPPSVHTTRALACRHNRRIATRT
ncbi:zinc-ribbon domain-containing protein [Streptomyces sp. NPDC019539]|uniref:zinc-ribbon domain-containing protein n=1 Tax=Streptomyces sp. NPDC019539 TaxID=3365063 RepID=UPI0037B10419